MVDGFRAMPFFIDILLMIIIHIVSHIIVDVAGEIINILLFDTLLYYKSRLFIFIA